MRERRRAIAQVRQVPAQVHQRVRLARPVSEVLVEAERPLRLPACLVVAALPVEQNPDGEVVACLPGGRTGRTEQRTGPEQVRTRRAVAADPQVGNADAGVRVRPAQPIAGLLGGGQGGLPQGGQVVPVATAAKVRLACHPHDPYTPPGYRGVTRVLGTVAGLKRFVQMHESPYHGLNFCQGTVAEMLDDPAREIFAVIHWFGERAKIFNVHFRNIKGKKLDFMEAFPDEGDMDMPKALAAYRDVGYRYMLMPDHVPQIDGRDPSGVAFAYCYGYIQALLDALVPRR